MDREKLIRVLKKSASRLRIVYGWDPPGKEPERPYAVLNLLYSNDVGADNINWVPRERWQLDLITDTRDEKLEARIESALRNEGIYQTKTQIAEDGDYIRMAYRFQTIGG